MGSRVEKQGFGAVGRQLGGDSVDYLSLIELLIGIPSAAVAATPILIPSFLNAWHTLLGMMLFLLLCDDGDTMEPKAPICD